MRHDTPGPANVPRNPCPRGVNAGSSRGARQFEDERSPPDAKNDSTAINPSRLKTQVAERLALAFERAGGRGRAVSLVLVRIHTLATLRMGAAGGVGRKNFHGKPIPKRGCIRQNDDKISREGMLPSRPTVTLMKH